MSVIPNGPLTNDLRKNELQMSMEDFVKLDGKPIMGIQSLRRAERGVPVGEGTLETIARLFDKRGLPKTATDLRLPDIIHGESWKEWLQKARKFDEEGRFDRAIEIVEMLIPQMQQRHCNAFDVDEVAARMAATFLDHSGEWDRALEIIENIVRRLALGNPHSRRKATGRNGRLQRLPSFTKNVRKRLIARLNDSKTNRAEFVRRACWVLYQHAVISRRGAEDVLTRSGKKTKLVKDLLVAAKDDLEVVLSQGDPDHRVSALHQLGVLHLLNSNFKLAISLFQQTLKITPTDISENRLRCAYTRRRLAAAHAACGKKFKAQRQWKAAEEQLGKSAHRLAVQIRLDRRASSP